MLGVNMLKNREEAEELAQEVLAMLAVRKDRSPDNIRAYAKTCLVHKIIDHQRRRKRRPRVSFDESIHSTAPQVRRASQQITDAELDAAIDSLRQKDRELCKEHLGGASYADLSEKYNVSEKTIGSRLSRIRRKLFEPLNEVLMQKNRMKP